MHPIESIKPAAPAPPATGRDLPSLLQSIMAAFEAETGLKMSFDDLTGVTTGVHQDVPSMQLHWDHQHHRCSFCVFAKVDPNTGVDCIRNKLAVNRLVMRRRNGVAGLCHLGLFDIAEPLIYQGRVLGVFYFGSVVVRGREEETKRRVRRYCAIRGVDPKGWLKALKDVTVIEPEGIPRYQEILRSIARLACFFCETSGVRADLYKAKPLKFPYIDPEEHPYVVKEAVHYIITHLDESFIIKDMAVHLRCHPDFLSRKFKQQTGVELSQYLQEARVNRAKRLLENPKITIGDAADQSGFSDRVHFSKVFRRLTGQSPGEFKRQLAAAESR